MPDVILSGASRGIGRALALALAAAGDRLLLVARDRAALEALAGEIVERGGRALVVAGDLSTLAGARALGEHLSGIVEPGATLVHNAGLWPSRRVVTEDGLEASFVVNHLAPLLLQAPLLARRLVRRVMVIGAGAMTLGRFDAARTPTGEDFARIRTYCTTKLCFAVTMRDVAAAHPEVDVVVLHPGIIRTDLGARRGPIGWLLSAAKRGLETPEACADRLVRLLARARWSPPGDARWLDKETERPWPAVADDPTTRQAIRDVTDRLLS